MKFSEKLQKLRKKNNLSQEQLADMLEVTRQSVSKWESGQTYPEMDKLISMCKIFKCSLDDLTNDEISDTAILENKKNNINSLVDSILELITKTYNMFKSMSIGSIIKCLFSMFVLALILLIFKIPFDYLSTQLDLIFSVIPNSTVVSLLTSVFDLIINLCYFILYFLILIYIFKIGYLDKYEEGVVYIEKQDITLDKNEKNEVSCKAKKIRKENNSGDAVFKFLGKIIMAFIKFLVVCLIVPFIFSLLGLSVAFAVAFLLLFKKVIYIGVLLGIIFAIVLNVLVIRVVIDFIFDKTVNVKKLFITFIVGLIGLGVSTGIFCLEVASTKFINDIPKSAVLKTDSNLIEFKDNMYFADNYYYDIEYKTDNSLKNNLRIDISYYEKYNLVDLQQYVDGNYIVLTSHIYGNGEGVLDFVNLIIKDLSNKEIYNYSKLYGQKVVVYASDVNIKKLKANSIKHVKEERAAELAYEKEENYCNETISDLEEKNNILESEKESLREKNDELQSRIDEYNDRIKELINE